ncbi:hypothetical protein BC834DRAFT_972727 [Gloeopeniophorella convolvens]|nr:hypothetical protein BC834DRAFT_972727 [Gloeopeniophorella convolvens]
MNAKYISARKFLATHKILSVDFQSDADSLLAAVVLATDLHATEVTAKTTLAHVAELVKHIQELNKETHNISSAMESATAKTKNCIAHMSDNILRAIDEIGKAMGGKLVEITDKLSATHNTQNGMMTATQSIEQAALNIQGTIQAFNSNMDKMSDSSKHLETTANNYQDALVKGQQTQQMQQGTQHGVPLIDLRVTRDVDKKARQVLVDFQDEDLTVETDRTQDRKDVSD